MKITEQNKQEAEKVVEMYLPMVNIKDFFGDNVEMRNGINCAIQDRQSVLEAFKQLFPLQSYDDELILVRKCKDIIEQITYLKTKL
jgi:hypothetical protein